MRSAIKALALLLCLAVHPAWALTCASAQFDTLSGLTCGAPSVLPGKYAIATLPDPTLNQARYAFVTDLGGGADMVLSDGTYWKHIRQGVATNIAMPSNGIITVTALTTPPIMNVIGSTQTLNANIVLQMTGTLYPGYTFQIIYQNALIATAGSFGVSLSNGASTLQLPLTKNSQIIQFNGNSLVNISPS